jgi:cytochrome c
VKVALLEVLTAILLLAFDSAEAHEVRCAGSADAGAAVFQKCMAGHQVGPNAQNGIGPILNGIVGRQASQYPGYSYSSANKASGLIWDEQSLARYLRAPGDFVPGTKMIFTGLKKEQELADILAYLKRFDRKGNVANP